MSRPDHDFRWLDDPEHGDDSTWLAIDDAEFDEATGHVARSLSEGPVAIELERPSEALWSSIASELASTSLGARAIGSDPDRSSGYGPAPGSAAARAQSRWSGRTAFITLVAAAILLVLVPAVLAIRTPGDDTEFVASADLDPLVSEVLGGNAEMVMVNDAPALELQLPDTVTRVTTSDDEFLELWLLHVADDGNVETLSLGRVEGSGRYAVPADVDRGRFNVVDISVELDDGDDAHSGNSILRGELTA